LSVGVMEIFFRVFIPVTDVPFYFWDPVIGPRRAPNQTGRRIIGNYRNTRYHFNVQGWNHPKDYVVAKPAGTRRVCLVGDSFVESLHVNPEETMFAVAERRMNRPERPVEWYAFGNSGFGTEREYELIRHYVLEYQPEVVILLFVQNDPFDCSPYLAEPSPYNVTYRLNNQGKLSFEFPTAVWRPSRWRRLAAQSALVRYFIHQRMLLERLHALRVSPPAEQGIGGLPLQEQAVRANNSSSGELTGMSIAERQLKTWQLIEALLRAARDECFRRGAAFGLAFCGWHTDIDRPLTGASSRVPPKAVDPYCLLERLSEMGREQLGPIAERLGIPYLDLTDPLREMVARTGKSHCFPDDYHYGAVGHAAAGEALATFVESIWQQSPTQPVRQLH
ncbi:MAG: hypothetical protein DMG06_26785, partial [Acidobacteria bacterium]